ncbi:RsmB/NOP family class I SAM-dependent RNA methyltransferase [Deinococcus maricopensis]|uniref:NusB/RsmB/TIM44 n=1 Tax=Deinococcus maricopensis (strain DSM 21211 / LMG 22137 / NRRL B-23946 / LB-34) TaxID=709986 RepID=E8U963_DEIML|nr:RsmB/NOP family class I SAM-dependent RNA methyltransferase [Deinococcus maricopensis]ADV67602.1 NusB/RsmB/TIM44 [Deinococcus maricopensis DSM 21211]
MTDAPTRAPRRANPARAVAVRVLARVLGGAFAAPTLDEALAHARLPARDAGLATHIVYGALRHAPTLLPALDALLKGSTPIKARALLLAGAFEKLVLGTAPHAAVSEYVTLARDGFASPGLVNAVLRRVDVAPDASPYALPSWLEQEFRTAFGEVAPDAMLDQLQPSPLWLYLDDAGVRALDEEGSAVEGGRGDVYRVALDRPLRETRAYRTGHAQPINPASHACVLALGDVDGLPVLDLAGGAGVKAAMLARRGARVTSVDKIAGKHRAARENLARLGVQAQFVTADLTRPLNAPPAPLVLLDAPCTGSGTLRAHPEIKLRLTEPAVGEMAALQRTLLTRAADLVQPGGTLVYSVCSLADAEGPQVAAAFLAEHPDFQAEALPDLHVPVVQAGPGVRTVPVEGVDGFFIVRLHRRAQGA